VGIKDGSRIIGGVSGLRVKLKVEKDECFNKCEHGMCKGIVKAIRKSVRKRNPKYVKKCFDCPYACDICCIFELDRHLP